MTLSTHEILRHLAQFPPMVQFFLIAVSSAFTEEVAVIGVLGLVRAGRVSLVLALLAIFNGTTLLNIGLYLGGRFAGKKALNWKLFRKYKENGTLDALHRHVGKEGWVAVAISRFVPGTRLAIFALSGILGMELHVYLVTIIASTVVWMLMVMGLLHVVIEMARDQPVLLAGLVVALGIGVIVFLRQKNRTKKTDL